MNFVQKIGVYGLNLCMLALAVTNNLVAKENRENATANSGASVNNAANNRAINISGVSEFTWDDHNILTWDDFKGAVHATSEESAAATHCGIGFKTCRDASGKPGIVVYNTFYVNKSWVRPDAKIAEILVHEQGHFDLCELYTRKLRVAMSGVDLTVPNLKQVLQQVYFQVKEAYETRQMAYESETTHGTNFPQQTRWRNIMRDELNRTGANNNSYASNR